MYTVYTHPQSRSLRVLWALEELSAEYEIIKVDLLTPTPRVVSPHPRGKVPFLVDGDTSVCETMAICIYLCQQQPGTSLYSTQVDEQAQINAWLSFAMTDLETPVWGLLRQKIFVPEAERCEEMTRYFQQDAERALASLRLEHRWIAGDTFTIADIFMSHVLSWARQWGLELNQSLHDYIDAATNRPAFLRAQAINEA